MTKLAFIDTETTGLDARRHGIWELAMILRDDAPETAAGSSDTEYLWQFDVNVSTAEPIALKINGFYDRRWTYPVDDDFKSWDHCIRSAVDGRNFESEGSYVIPSHHMKTWAERFVRLTNGAHLVGNVVSFDEERLRHMVYKGGYTPMWHYHLVDVEALAAGRLGIQPPWKSSEVLEAIDVPTPEDQHGALPDARWARDAYDAVFIHVMKEQGHPQIFPVEQ